MDTGSVMLHSHIRSLCSAILMLALCGCGEQRIQVLKDDPMAMLHTQTEFTIRSNRCGCIVNTPELDYEIAPFTKGFMCDSQLKNKLNLAGANHQGIAF